MLITIESECIVIFLNIDSVKCVQVHSIKYFPTQVENIYIYKTYLLYSRQ